MSYVVEITKTGKAQAQAADKSFDMVIKVGVAFADKQVPKRKGYYVDCEALAELIEKQAAYLSSKPWADLFKFTPTAEHVAKWLAEELGPQVKQLEYVELDNQSAGIVTQYIP
jgi:hypothetical protein